MRAPPRPGTWDNAGCGSYCRRSRYGRSPHSAPHARRAALDGAHHLELVKAHAAAVGIAPCGPVAAEDVRDLQTWPGHAGGLRPRSDCSLRYERREPVQRAHDLANEASTGGTASREPAPAGRREACMRPNGCRPWQARRLALLLCGKLPPGGNRRSKLSGRSAVPTRHFCLISADAGHAVLWEAGGQHHVHESTDDGADHPVPALAQRRAEMRLADDRRRGAGPDRIVELEPECDLERERDRSPQTQPEQQRGPAAFRASVSRRAGKPATCCDTGFAPSPCGKRPDLRSMAAIRRAAASNAASLAAAAIR